MLAVFLNSSSHYCHRVIKLINLTIFLNSYELSLEIKYWIIDVGLHFLFDFLFLLMLIGGDIADVNEVILQV